jgi:hypothetical protein
VDEVLDWDQAVEMIAAGELTECEPPA